MKPVFRLEYGLADRKAVQDARECVLDELQDVLATADILHTVVLDLCRLGRVDILADYVSIGNFLVAVGVMTGTDTSGEIFMQEWEKRI